MSEAAEVQKVPAEINELRWKNLRKRHGKFSITHEMLEDSHTVVQAIMGECITTRCEHHWHSDAFEFNALSWQFRETTEGEMAPVYTWTIDEDLAPHATEAKGGAFSEVMR